MADIVIIANDPDSKTRLEDVVFQPLEKSFILGVPESVLADCARRGINASFFTNSQASFYGYDSLADLESAVKIEGLEAAINNSTLKIASNFIGRIEHATMNNTPAPHNGATFGVSTITTSRSNDAEERVTIEIGCHHSNYLTSAIMNDVFKVLHAQKIALFDDANLRRMPQLDGTSYGFMFNSFGLHVSVVIGDDFVFGIRPGNKRYHFPVNEGLRPDAEIPLKEKFNLSAFYNRAMREELGVRPSVSQKTFVRELFFVKSDGTMEIHVLSELSGTKEDFMARHKRAKDSYENDGMIFTPFTKSGLGAVLNDPKIGMYDFGREIITGLTLDMD